MVLIRFRTAAILVAAAIGASACSYDDGYGYGGLSVGYGGGYYGGGYYDPYDDYAYGYGGAFGSPYWGWYGDYYYPGTGIYVYDRYRRPHRWNDYQRRYWSDRRDHWRGRDRDGIRDNWRDFPRAQDGRRDNWQTGNRRYWGNRGSDGAATQQGSRGNWRGNRGDNGASGSGDRQQRWQGRTQWRSQQSAAPQGTVQTRPSYPSGGSAGHGGSRGGGRRGH